MPTEQQVANEILARIKAQLSGEAAAFEPDEVPSPRPGEHVVVTVVRRAGGAPRSGRYSTTGWSAYVMAASQTAAQNARASLQEARQGLESVVITVDGVESTPIRFDSARVVGPDDGWFSGVNVYAFTL
jgi:hypothetical protein